MTKFTVAMMRPYRFILEGIEDFNTLDDLSYLAQVEAETVRDAIKAARVEVHARDQHAKRQMKARFLPPIRADEYTMVWVFAGHHSAVAYGFEGQT